MDDLRRSQPWPEVEDKMSPFEKAFSNLQRASTWESWSQAEREFCELPESAFPEAMKWIDRLATPGNDDVMDVVCDFIAHHLPADPPNKLDAAAPFLCNWSRVCGFAGNEWGFFTLDKLLHHTSASVRMAAVSALTLKTLDVPSFILLKLTNLSQIDPNTSVRAAVHAILLEIKDRGQQLS